MSMFTITNQSSVAKALHASDDAGPMKPSAYYDHIIAVMKEFVRFTVLARPHAAQLANRYSKRKDADVEFDPNADLSAIATAPQASRS